jgi:RNA polymerase sigma-70 factor (ECF subfamily)
LRQEDRDALFSELYRRYAARIYRDVLLPRLGNKAAAEDALSETFRTLLEKLESIDRRDEKLWPWLATVATNKANDMFRMKNRTGRALVNLEELLAPLRTPSPHAEQELDQKREQERIKDAIARVLGELNPRYRSAIELRFFKDESRETCASALEVEVSTFDVLLCRALKSFRKEWARLYGAATEGVGT